MRDLFEAGGLLVDSNNDVFDRFSRVVDAAGKLRGLVTVRDLTPPVLTASLVPVSEESRRESVTSSGGAQVQFQPAGEPFKPISGVFAVQYEAVDACDDQLDYTARLCTGCDRLPVHQGQLVKFRFGSTCKYRQHPGYVEIISSYFLLQVTATDDAGMTANAETGVQGQIDP